MPPPVKQISTQALFWLLLFVSCLMFGCGCAGCGLVTTVRTWIGW